MAALTADSADHRRRGPDRRHRDERSDAVTERSHLAAGGGSDTRSGGGSGTDSGSGTRAGSGRNAAPARLGPVSGFPDAGPAHGAAGAASGPVPTSPVGQTTRAGWSSTVVTLGLLLGIVIFGSAALLAFRPARRLIRPASRRP